MGLFAKIKVVYFGSDLSIFFSVRLRRTDIHPVSEQLCVPERSRSPAHMALSRGVDGPVFRCCFRKPDYRFYIPA